MRYDHILSMLGNGWAILPETFSALAEALDRMIAGEAPGLENLAAIIRRKGETLEISDLAALAASGKQDGEDLPYTIQDGVAVLPVVGTMVKRNGMFSCFNTYQDIQSAIAQALDDPKALAILLMIDSPGGSVDGCQELAEYIAAANDTKPVYAFADGQMTSAAYWIASGACEIAAPPSAVVGSIGVITMHTDRSGQDKQRGTARTFITAGQYKAAGHDAAPLSSDDREIIQQRLDGFYSLFLNGIAANRDLDTADAASWADGKVFLADQAQKAGLIDNVMNLDAFMGRIREQVAQGQTNKGVLTMKDLSTLKATYPALMQEHQAEIEAAAKAKGPADPGPDLATVKDAATKAERENLLGLAKAVLGDEQGAKLEAVASAGLSAEQLTALSASGLMVQPGAAAQPAGAEGGADLSSRKEMLEAINKAGAAPLAGAAGAKPVDEKAKLVAAMASGMKGIKS